MPNFRHVDPDSPEGRAIAAELGCEWSSKACKTAAEREVEIVVSHVLPQERTWSAIARDIGHALPAERLLPALWGAVASGDVETYMVRSQRVVRLVLERKPRQRRRRASQVEIRAALERCNRDGRWRTIREYQVDTGYTRQQIERCLRTLMGEGAVYRRKRDHRAYEYNEHEPCDARPGPACATE